MSSVQKQILALRERRDSDRTLRLSGEKYILDQAITIGKEDSGLIIDGQGTEFFCGIQLNGWKEDGECFFAAPIPNGADPAAFLVNGAFRPESRFPESGALNHVSTTDVRWMGSTGGGWNRSLSHDELCRVIIDPETLPDNIRLEKACITVFHEWDESTVRIRSYDRASGFIQLESELEHPAGSFDKNTYVIWGIREGMSHPGQWYVDHQRSVLVYYPLPGEDMSRAETCIPNCDHAFYLNGAENIEIKNIRITCCNSHHRKSGLRAADCPGAVECVDCSDITLDHVDISYVAGAGIKVTRSRSVDIRNCTITHTGAGGIFQSETMPARIVNNRLTFTGERVFSSVAIQAGGKSQYLFVVGGCKAETGSVLISHNTIDSAPYCGIACCGGPHIIEGNRISRCMSVLRDGGAIYCSRAADTIIRRNFVCGIETDPHMAVHSPKKHAYYFDEMSFNSVLEENVSVDSCSPALNHLSSHCLCRGNVFLNTGDMTISMVSSDHFLFENNVFAASGDLTLRFITKPSGIPWGFKDVYQIRNCVIWAGKSLKYHSNTYGEPREAVLAGGEGIIYENPMITYTERGHAVVSDSSPLRTRDFRWPDLADVGSSF